MNFPRFSNPHIHTQQLETISRSDLLQSDPEVGFTADSAADVEELDALVKRALGNYTVSEPPRKKRKKKHAREDDARSGGSLVCGSRGFI